MSSSTYLKIVTRSKNWKPIAEIEYLLYSSFDCWNVTSLFHEDRIVNEKGEAHTHSYNVFKVIMYEFDRFESIKTIDEIKLKAKYLNIDLEIDTMSSSVSNDYILNYNKSEIV